MTSFIQIGAVLLLVIFCYQIIAPFIGIVLWGLIIAVALYPLHQSFAVTLGDRQKLSATLMVLIALAVLIIPVAMMTDSSIESASSLSSDLRAGTLTIPPPSDRVAGWPLIGSRTHEIWSGAA
ncbi:MAG: AI-2E family transporter, partial [Gammaproteobacteria bacterium]|nr:AI-2E family transporter [Gammaproteobacteria bacterium]